MGQSRNDEQREYDEREKDSLESVPDEARGASLQPHHGGEEATHEEEQLHPESMDGIVDDLKLRVLEVVLSRPDRSLVKG